MNGFTEFKKILGYSSKKLEEITGYTRQGLHFTFNNMDKGVKPQKKFLVCINSVIAESIQEETKRHESRMEELRELQYKIIGCSGVNPIKIKVKLAYESNGYIGAIREYRFLTESGLKDAVDTVKPWCIEWGYDPLHRQMW